MNDRPTLNVAEPEIVDAPAVPYVGISHQVTMGQMGQPAESFDTLYGWIAAHQGTPAGPPFYRYVVIDMENELTVEAGVPVAEALPGDERIIAGTLPAGRYLTINHVGHPDELEAVTAHLLAHADAQGLRFDCSADQRDWVSRLEFYGSNPDTEPDMTKWETELAFKLAD